ncbi:MAG: hypothetical protein IPG67_11280 [Acidobacteria bacterium]|nr:hypothetical protein [Acidobacteriota bacterium]
MTNTKIIELVRMGLGDALIIAKIKRSVCKCDTSTASIGKLKAAKISDSIIMAMMESSAGPIETPKAKFEDKVITIPTQAAAKPSTETVVDAGPKALNQIKEPGIYLFENERMSVIEASVFSGGKINPILGTITYGIKKTKWRAKVRGKSANLQVSTAQPVFYFVFNPDYKNSGRQWPDYSGACPQRRQTNSSWCK